MRGHQRGTALSGTTETSSLGPCGLSSKSRFRELAYGNIKFSSFSDQKKKKKKKAAIIGG